MTNGYIKYPPLGNKDWMDLNELGSWPSRAEDIACRLYDQGYDYYTFLRCENERKEFFAIGNNLEKRIKKHRRIKGPAYEITSPIALALLDQIANYELEIKEENDSILELSSILKMALINPGEYCWKYRRKVKEIFEELRYCASSWVKIELTLPPFDFDYYEDLKPLPINWTELF